jgi:uncharacterized protein YecE (DUF72 family)
VNRAQLVRIGVAGWNIPRDSAGEFPADGSHLQRYSRVFNSVEINSSFYREHRLSTWERWRDSVPDDFQFSVKAPRAITHDAKLRCEPEVLSKFLQQVEMLRKKLGPILFQLPPSLAFDRESVTAFLTMLRQHFAGDVVWEPRHKSWFEDAATEMLSTFRVARVAADPACAPGAAHPAAASDVVYFRLHGSPRLYYSAYDEDFLVGLAPRLAEFAATAKTWCVFDNTASGAATRNALELTRELSPRRS